MAAVEALERLTLSSELAAAEPNEVLQNSAILANMFSLLEDVDTLVRCMCVCRQWRSVLEADDIWRAVYLRALPAPQDYERVGSYRQQFKRLRGILEVPPPEPLPLKGTALCYNPATGHLVSYNPRQRMVSVQRADGSIKSELTDVEGGGTAHKPLLASTGCELVVLAAFDGALQLWDAAECKPAGLLGGHQSYVTSLDASGSLVASTCSSELRLWDLNSRQCLFQVSIGLPLPSPVLEPHVAVCHSQQLLALANCAAPAPSSVVKIYSTKPAGSSSSGGGGRPVPAAGQQQQPPAGSVTVGSSSCPGATGALLLRELPVNAAADMLLLPGLLLVASCFHGRSVSNTNTPYKSERPFTVVVQIWNTQTWQLTRLVSPRLWTDYPIYTMQGTPMITLSQGMLLCATLRSGLTKAVPSCCIHAWQLPASLVKAGQPAAAAAAGREHGSSGNGSSGLCLLSVSPNKSSSIGAAAAGTSRAAEPFGEGAVALGRAAVAVAGGAGLTGVSATNTVMLAVSDNERDSWLSLMDDTQGRLTVMLTTPTQLVMATETGQVLSSRLLPVEVDAEQPQRLVQHQQYQQQQQQQAGVKQQQEGSSEEQQQQQSQTDELQSAEVNGRFIHIDI